MSGMTGPHVKPFNEKRTESFAGLYKARWTPMQILDKEPQECNRNMVGT